MAALSLRRAAELRAAKRTASKATNQTNAGFKFPKGGNAAYRKAAVASYKSNGNLIQANKAGIAARAASATRAAPRSKTGSSPS